MLKTKKNINTLLTFYSWNENMDIEQVKEQIKDFYLKGFQGFYIHARAGLTVNYLSDEWFKIIKICLQQAEKYQFEVGIYDENGWPSGYAGGLVIDGKKDFMQKRLEFTENKNDQNILAGYKKTINGYVRSNIDQAEIFVKKVYCDYADLMNANATKEFIKCTHEQYKKHFKQYFGNTIKSIFTDEPQIAPVFCYTEGIESFFEKEYGYNMLDNLWKLLDKDSVFNKFCYDYQSLCFKLFKNNYTKVIAKWCGENGLNLTGHLSCEDNLTLINHNGGVLNHYIEMQQPGIDWIGKRTPPVLLLKQLSSVKNIFNKEAVLSEVFGCCGWNVTFEDLAYIWKWHAVFGINKACTHLSAYSIKGLRKRDYPAFFSYQEPWWEAFNSLSEYIKDINEYIHQPQKNDILVISPEVSAIGTVMRSNPSQEVASKFSLLIDNLTVNQLQYDIINEETLKNYCYFNENDLWVNQCNYKVIFIAKGYAICPDTLKILSNAKKKGVSVVYVESMPLYNAINGEKVEINDFTVIDNDINSISKYIESIFYKRKITVYNGFNRELDSNIIVNTFGDNHLLLNKSVNTDNDIIIESNGKIIHYNIKAKELFVLTPKYQNTVIEKYHKTSCLPQAIKINEYNTLTIDKACYSIDNKEFSPTVQVIDIEDKLSAMSFEKASIIYQFASCAMLNKLYLAAETENVNEIYINDKKFETSLAEKNFYIDKSITKYDISAYVKQGINNIVFVYDSQKIKTSELNSEHETKRNIFYYGLEIENIYILGDFSTECKGKVNYNINYLSVENAEFSINLPKKLELSELTTQGLWFYRGAVSFTYEYEKYLYNNRYLTIKNITYPVYKVYSENKFLGTIFKKEDKIDLSNVSSSDITIKAYISNRNALGPHHHVLGEPYVVGERTFRGVKGFEDELMESEFFENVYTPNYNFVKNEMPIIEITEYV